MVVIMNIMPHTISELCEEVHRIHMNNIKSEGFLKGTLDGSVRKLESIII